MKSDIAAHLKELLELEDEEIQEFYDAFIKEFDKSCTELQEDGVDADFQKLFQMSSDISFHDSGVLLLNTNLVSLSPQFVS